MSDIVPVFGPVLPKVRKVDLDRPWAWLGAGWRDLMRVPGVSLGYGALLAALSLALGLALWLADAFYLLLALTAGFSFVAPLLAVPLYDASRRLASGQPVSLGRALLAWRVNPGQLGLLGLVLGLLHLAWIRLATLLYALFFSGQAPSLSQLIDNLLFSSVSLPFLIVGTLLGFALAALAFAIAAVSIPMLVDRDTNVFTAIATSFVAVAENPRPMALWAVLIAGFTAFGLVTFFVGLALVLPLVAHATWHCYRDVVVTDQASEATAR
ncbi:MAG: DUF2189 domain-containing protein [Reyranellaceae bacterium]